MPGTSRVPATGVGPIGVAVRSEGETACLGVLTWVLPPLLGIASLECRPPWWWSW